MPDTLESSRLALRRRVADDADWSLELLLERDDPPVRTLDDARARLLAQEEDAARNGFGFYAIRLRADPAAQPVGCCGLLVGRSTVDEPELAYELLRRAHGHGYATEAARLVVDAAFATGRKRLCATVRPANVASLRVLDRLGFRVDRTTIDDGAELIWLVRER